MKPMIREEIEKLTKRAIKDLYGKPARIGYVKGIAGGEAEVEIEHSAEPAFGDYSTNIAMIIKKNPQEIANAITRFSSPVLGKVEVKNGFINFFISKEYLQKQVEEILKEKDKFGNLKIGKGKKVNVEFISANPTGPLTVGNSRGGVIGDVLSNVLAKAGWKVTREYYFNDAGGQIDVLGHSVLKDDLAEYKGEYIDKLAKKLDGGDPREIGKKAAQIIIEEIKKTTKKMGIKFDIWTAEGRDLRDKGKVEKIIAWLKKNNLAYEKEGALWFKSTQFGDDKDRVLLRTNKEPTYFALDCAYHKNKFVERKFDKVINIWGADHHGDIARLKGFVKSLGYEDKFDILIQQFVRIIKKGKEVRMSKRTGIYVTIDELIDEVGLDVARFFFLTKAADTHLDFDLDLAKQQSEKNPVYYVQYAHARICSILRKIKEKISLRNYELLKEPSELELIKQLVRLPEIIKDTAKDYQIQRIPQYAIDLATVFHQFYRDCQVLSDDKELTQARLALISATKIVLKNTLNLMGIFAPEKM